MYACTFSVHIVVQGHCYLALYYERTYVGELGVCLVLQCDIVIVPNLENG